MIKHWWSERTMREKILLKSIFLFVISYIILNNIVCPLYTAIQQRTQHLIELRATSRNVDIIARQIQTFTHAGVKLATATTTNTATTVQKSLQYNKLSNYLTQIKQPAPNQVLLTFAAIPFDKLKNWLMELTQQSSLKIMHWDVKKSHREGTVFSKISIQRK